VGGAVAEELAESLLVVGDPVLLDQGDEIGWSVAGERRFREMGVRGKKVFGAGMEVGEVAAAASGDEDFLAGFFGVLDEQDAAVAAAGFDGAHQAGGSCSEDDGVECGWLL